MANTFFFMPVSIKRQSQRKPLKEKIFIPKILKQNLHFFAVHAQKNINPSISALKFPNNLKSKLSKEDYRPISILPNISKVNERCLYDQTLKYFETRFSKFQCGFRKGYSAQHCLLAMIKKRKTAVDNGVVFAALLTDLSKAIGCIPHDLIITKLPAHSFDTNSLKPVNNYLSNRRQRVKVNSAYSICKDMFYGFPQGSILEPLLFNIYSCETEATEVSLSLSIYQYRLCFK